MTDSPETPDPSVEPADEQVPEAAAPAKRTFFGSAERPNRRAIAAQREAAKPPAAPSPMAEDFHKRSSLVPTAVVSRPAPLARVGEDAGRVVTKLGRAKYAKFGRKTERRG